MNYSPLLDELIKALRCLPGVGQKSAQRMAFHLLERNRKGALDLSEALKLAMENIGHCERCRNFSETPLCTICDNPRRDKTQLCVVETPADVVALEQSAGYSGVYFVLMGHISPLDGIGPAELGLDRLRTILQEDGVRELILATSTTVEGETTAHYVADMARAANISVSRIAYGVPLGGELDLIDSGTLSHALSERKLI